MRLGTTVGARPDRIDRTPERFEFVELAVGEHQLAVDDIDRAALRDRLDAAGLDLCVHLPFKQPLATTVPALVEANLEYLDGLLDVCADLDAEKAIVHGTARDPSAEAERGVFRETVADLAARGDERGIEVCVENARGATGGLPVGVVGSLVEEAGASLCLDVGHAYLDAGQGGLESFAERHAHLVSHVHVHDARSRGDSHIPVGSGEIDLDPVAAALGDFDDTAAIEVFSDDPVYLERSAERFRAAFE
jgi:sugar phosphate isomerase/epimerase